MFFCSGLPSNCFAMTFACSMCVFVRVYNCFLRVILTKNYNPDIVSGILSESIFGISILTFHLTISDMLSYFLAYFLAFDRVYLGRFFVVESNNPHLTGGEKIKQHVYTYIYSICAYYAYTQYVKMENLKIIKVLEYQEVIQSTLRRALTCVGGFQLVILRVAMKAWTLQAKCTSSTAKATSSMDATCSGLFRHFCLGWKKCH